MGNPVLNPPNREADIRSVKTVEQKVRLDAWRAVFEKTNRIISGRPIKVDFAEAGGSLAKTPAWSDGADITFNLPMMQEMVKTNQSVEAVLRLKGLNYHELCHILFTPRASDELPSKVRKTGDQHQNRELWWYAMNALEDQRIETWFTAMYEPSRRYFEAAVLQWLVEEGNAECAILVYGRKFLPAHIRVKAGEVFVAKHGQELYDKFRAIIDQYLTVILPRESNRAFMLVKAYVELLESLQDNSVQRPALMVQDNCAPGGADGTSVQHGRVLQSESKEAQKAAVKAIEAAAAADAELAKQRAEAAAKAAQGADDKGKQAQADGQDTGTTDGQQAGDKGEIGNDQGSGHSADGSDGEGGGIGASDTGTADHDGSAAKEKRDAIQDAMRDLLGEARKGVQDIQNDAEIKADAKRVLDAVKATVNNGMIEAKGRDVLNKARRVSPSSQTLLSMRRVVVNLMKIRQEVEPQILRGQATGRVDMRRLLSRNPNDFDIFTSYDEGAEETTGIEAVVLVDVSGSMNYRMSQTCEAMWVLKRAFDKLDIRCTVILYDTTHSILFQPTAKAGGQVPYVGTGGGTDPSSALTQAEVILTKSHQPSKVLITLTDGQWGGDVRRTDRVIANLTKRGVHTMLLGLNGAVKSYGKHGHAIAHNIGGPEDLPKAALKLVSEVMRVASNQV